MAFGVITRPAACRQLRHLLLAVFLTAYRCRYGGGIIDALAALLILECLEATTATEFGLFSISTRHATTPLECTTNLTSRGGLTSLSHLVNQLANMLRTRVPWRPLR